jgi:hypothetical protein
LNVTSEICGGCGLLVISTGTIRWTFLLKFLGQKNLRGEWLRRSKPDTERGQTSALLFCLLAITGAFGLGPFVNDRSLIAA